MNYRKQNLYLGWFVFLIATIVYFLTIEDTVSLWDCGEYITAAYKLEVGHPPGAPFFMILGRLFSFFAAPENVAVWINRLSALCSSLTILFMFWSITMFAKKIALKTREVLSRGDEIAILGAGFIGALAYTFTDSFWFSAVEGEVYAMSSMFTAVIFWAALKWDEEMALRTSKLDKSFNPDRWLLLIMFLLGLAIGVHLLGILVVPAITFLVYFQYARKVEAGLFIATGVLSIVILGFIQSAVIPGSISLASSFEVIFKNTLGLPFYTGTIFFFALVIGICILLLRLSRKTNIPLLYNGVMGLVLLLIGYGTFAVIVIRSNANTPLDENDPENLVTLKAYLNREQYGSAPILYGPYWNSQPETRDKNADLSAFYLRRFVVVDNDVDVKAFKDEARAKEYASKNGGEVVEKYFESNSRIRTGGDQRFQQNTIFPRMYYSVEPGKISGYKQWSGYNPSEDKGTEKGKDNLRLPTFGENLSYFFNYQINFMYTRYFLWNFAGRQNDIQNHDGDQMRGNWISGFAAVDNARLGNQDEHAPYFTSSNKSNNKFFYLPLILALIGLVFHFRRAPKDAFVLLLAFLFTGLAIVVYLNQKPMEPRERDYAYAGSFYFFAMWIGIGVYALYEAFKSFGQKEWKGIGMIAGIGLLFMLFMDSNSMTGMPLTLSWVIMAAIAAGGIGLMYVLRKVLKSETQGAVVAILLALFVPVIMGMQGWDDHDRSNKFSARDLAYNYLEPCSPNAILFTNGDNDTFPLWYMQEVEGKRTDVRVCNLSLMQTDWYTDQMKMKAYESEPLPIKFTEDQILMYAGSTDQVIFIELANLFGSSLSKESLRKVIEMRAQNNQQAVAQKISQFETTMSSIVNQIQVSGKGAARINLLRSALTTSGSFNNITDNIFTKYTASFEIISGLRSGVYTLPENVAKQFTDALLDLEKGWDAVNLADAMEFVRDEKNVISSDGNYTYHFFPSRTFTLPVNKSNVKASKILANNISEAEMDDVVRFSYDARFEGESPTQYLSREEVMMMDILANNEWKRGIYFSSPGGSAVSKALYYGGYVLQEGLTYVFVPQRSMQTRFAMDAMYNNLMKVYKFDGLNDINVLTDYYTRRNTSQYRYQFLVLANEYASQYDRAGQINPEMISMLKQQGDTARAMQMQKELDSYANKDEFRKRALALVDRSLEVMPADVVLDYGEPTTDGRKYPNTNTAIYRDGNLGGYVELYYRLGAKDKAEALGAEVASQLESIIDYYLKSDPNFAGSSFNNKDLFAALENYMNLMMAANNPESNPDGKLARRTGAKIQELYNTSFPSLLNKLKTMASENGESVRYGTNMGIYTSYYFNVKDGIEAVGAEYGIMERKAAPPQPAQQQQGPALNLMSPQPGQ